MRAALPPLTRMATMAAFAMANVQVALGITTLLYLVPVPLAAVHQAGSVMLLSAMVHLLISMRAPGLASRIWRPILSKAKKITIPWKSRLYLTIKKPLIAFMTQNNNNAFQEIYRYRVYNYPDIWISSSVAAVAAVVVLDSVDSLAIMVFKNGSTDPFSRMRNDPPGEGTLSCSLVGPTIPMDVLLTLSSLSCWRVSRSACNPCRTRSSSEPENDKYFR